jgi:hypothetical protein
MTPQAMRAAQLPAELQIHETAEYRVNALQSIAKLWLSLAALVGGPSAIRKFNGVRVVVWKGRPPARSRWNCNSSSSDFSACDL